MLDIIINRKTEKYTGSELFRRLLWKFSSPFFQFSPRVFFGWRRFLLRLFGAKIGVEVHIYNSATIYMPWNLEIGDWSSIGEHAYIYSLGRITIGSRATISQHAYLCAGTHDYTDPTLPLVKSNIFIGDQAWICADAFIGPDVRIGEGAVVGARAVAVKNIDPWIVAAGNPARFIKKRELKAGHGNK